MKTIYHILNVCIFFLLLVSCQKEGIATGVGSVDGSGENISLVFSFAGKDETSRAATPAEEEIMLEEGKVSNLLYAVFQSKELRVMEYVDLSGLDYSTGENNLYETEHLDKTHFDANTEIFVVANVTEEIKKNLTDTLNLTGEDLYMRWRRYEYNLDLNAESGKAESRRIENPLMAGYLPLSRNFDASIIVHVEHIYCRIWFEFEWKDVPEAERVVIDSITIDGLVDNTWLFNTETQSLEYNPNNPKKSKEKVENYKTQNPFLGDLTLKEYPYHDAGEDGKKTILMRMEKRNYKTVCRYPLENGEMSKTQRPVRYYVYSYQWAGITIDDDPLVTLYYHFKKKDNSSTDGSLAEVHKWAKARLYDETHYPGKRHHGLLRNYTYKLDCEVSTLTNSLDLHIMSVPWLKHDIDDIPVFE